MLIEETTKPQSRLKRVFLSYKHDAIMFSTEKIDVQYFMVYYLTTKYVFLSAGNF